MSKHYWLLFVLLAGLSWGVYVPSIAFGGRTLKNSYASFLCVGIAYFLIAIVVPMIIFWARGQFPTWNATGATFATLAGVAGAVGALCVIFATFEFHGDRKLVGPLIFGLAPIINTVVSIYWHPLADKPLRFYAEPVSWQFWTGIVLAGAGAFLVLYSKEASESSTAKPAPAKVAFQEPAQQAPVR
ncbi:MAG TPA: hypothetical protein VFA18_00775 [Gemmataceae bacterium]|nr:hypothetical protein [Gemmataceae bacterium]